LARLPFLFRGLYMATSKETSLFMPYIAPPFAVGSYLSLPSWVSTEGVDLSWYWTMMRVDPTVKAGIDFLKLSIRSRLSGFRHPDPTIQEFVDFSLSQMQGTLHDVVDDLLSALWAGFAVAEIVYQPADGKVIWKKIKALNPVTIYPTGIETDDKGNLKRIVQRVGSEEVELPLERTILWSFASDFGNPWGNSLLRPAFQHFIVKQALIRLWNTHLERQATPLAVATIPQAEMPVWCPIHQREERFIEAMRHILEDLKNRTSLVISGNAEVEFPSIQPRGELFDTAIRYHDVQILRALLIPSLLVSEAEYGTRAQAVVHREAFELALEGIIAELKAVLEEQLFRRLIELNFGAGVEAGEVVFERRVVDVEVLANVVFRLASMGMMRWTADDEGVLRKLLGLGPVPEKTEPVPQPAPAKEVETRIPPEALEKVPPEGGGGGK